MNVGSIDYDALQMALVKRFSSSYSFRVSYTLGYSRGDAGRNPYTATFESERNGATGPGFFQLDLRLGSDFLNLTTLRSGAVPSTLQLGARFEF